MDSLDTASVIICFWLRPYYPGHRTCRTDRYFLSFAQQQAGCTKIVPYTTWNTTESKPRLKYCIHQKYQWKFPTNQRKIVYRLLRINNNNNTTVTSCKNSSPCRNKYFQKNSPCQKQRTVAATWPEPRSNDLFWKQYTRKCLTQKPIPQLCHLVCVDHLAVPEQQKTQKEKKLTRVLMYDHRETVLDFTSYRETDERVMTRKLISRDICIKRGSISTLNMYIKLLPTSFILWDSELYKKVPNKQLKRKNNILQNESSQISFRRECLKIIDQFIFLVKNKTLPNQS